MPCRSQLRRLPRCRCPGMMRASGNGNRLLAMLPQAEFDLLASELETVALNQDAVLARAGEPTEYVFFPHSGAVSLMLSMANGQTVATALIGREGALGSLRVFGPSPSATTAIVHLPGTASRIPAARFHAAFNRSPAVRYVLQLHIRALLLQLQHGAACNALHPVKARMARWLLHVRDLVDGDVLPLTQETLSQILGVRRTTVNLLMRHLRASGAIRADRRGEIVVDRLRLEATACECHGNMRFEVEEIFAQSAMASAVLPKAG